MVQALLAKKSKNKRTSKLISTFESTEKKYFKPSKIILKVGEIVFHTQKPIATPTHRPQNTVRQLLRIATIITFVGDLFC